jgi:hypothetical protein
MTTRIFALIIRLSTCIRVAAYYVEVSLAVPCFLQIVS